MAIPQYFQEACEINREASLLQKWKSSSADATSMDTANGCFDCNICLENAQDPVVTLCGHLYCWPCIYKWLHLQGTSINSEHKEQQQCPVCKADVSHTTLVPLYGRGPSTPQDDSEDIIIPRRPPACGVHALLDTTNSSTMSDNPYQRYPTASMTTSPRGTSTTTMSFVNPMMGVFGEMVYARMFGNPELNFYSGYQDMGGSTSSSPRVRRQEMQVDKSLNRISFFLFCCVVLCLLLF